MRPVCKALRVSCQAFCQAAKRPALTNDRKVLERRGPWLATATLLGCIR